MKQPTAKHTQSRKNTGLGLLHFGDKEIKLLILGSLHDLLQFLPNP